MMLSRRRLLTLGSTAFIGAPFIARAQQAEFTYKYANNLPATHPMNTRAHEMAAAIKAETNGRFDLQIFPSSQLGSRSCKGSEHAKGQLRPPFSACASPGAL